ncbi:uncharacterized protein METZ01_LOCUS189261, partial [marine metagenome]
MAFAALSDAIVGVRMLRKRCCRSHGFHPAIVSAIFQHLFRTQMTSSFEQS